MVRLALSGFRVTQETDTSRSVCVGISRQVELMSVGDTIQWAGWALGLNNKGNLS